MATIAKLDVILGATIGPFVSGLSAGKKGIAGFASSVKSASASIGGALNAGLSGVTTIIDAAKAVAHFAGAGEESEMQLGKLNSVLAATGNTTGFTANQLTGLASDLQKVTNFEDEATVGAETVLASFKNISGDTFKTALTSAMDLTTIIGGDLQTNALKLGKALDNPLAGMKSLSKVGIVFTDQQQSQIKALQQSGDLMGAQAIILNEVQGKFGGAAQAAASPLTILGHLAGEIFESIGKSLLAFADLALTTFGPIFETIAAVVESVGPRVAAIFTDLATTIGSTLGFSGDSMLSLADIANSVVDAVQQGVIILEFGFTHWRDLGKLVFLAWAYHLVSFAAQVTYQFTVVIPALLQWFSNNWRQYFTDVMNITSTIATNIWKNLSALWDGIVGLFTGDGFSFEWTPLTKGFESAIKELPKIAERELGPLESSLKKQITDLTGNIGEDFAKFKADRTQSIAAGGNSIKDKLAKGIGAFAGNGSVAAGGGGAANSLLAGAGNEKLGALVKGSVEAFKAEKANAGMNTLTDLSRKQLDEQKKMNEHLEGLDDEEGGTDI